MYKDIVQSPNRKEKDQMGNKKSKARGLYKETFTENGKRYYCYGKTKQELAEKVLKKHKELENKALERENPTLESYYEHFTDIKRQELREATVRNQIHRFRLIADVMMETGETFGNMRIRDIKRRDIEFARAKLLEAGKKPECLNPYFEHLNHVFNNAVIDETIDKNPCAKLKHLKRETKPIGETKHRALTIEETQRFFQVAEQRNSFYLFHFKMMINTGMRFGELTALYPGDISSGFIHITKSITRAENGAYTVGQYTKTVSGKRDFPLNSELKKIITSQRKQNEMIFNDMGGLVFRSYDGEIARDYTVNREIERICKDAGIEKFTCHAFRSTFATRFLEQRPQDFKILSELLGHKDISITLNTYAKVMVASKVRAMEELIIKTS